jgi:hypothetical protein
MKWITRSITLFVCCIMGVSVQAAPVIEKPVVLPEAMLSVTVSDFHGFIDEVGAVAAKVSPMMNGAFIKSMIGMPIGDPYLSGIPEGKGLAIVALDVTNMFAVVELSEAQSTNYLNMVQSQGLLAKYDDGALLLARSPEALVKGESRVASVREILLGQSSSTLNVALQPAAIIERNAAAIDGVMQMLPIFMGQGLMQQPGATLDSAQSITQLLEGELRVLLSIASQCEVAEVILAPKDGSIQLSKTFEPKAGTRLATLLNSPTLSEEKPELHAGLLGAATILADFHLGNPEALGEFFGAEVATLLQAMQWGDVEVAGLVATTKKWFNIYSGTGCEAVTLGPDGNMKLAYIVGINDEAETLDVMRAMGADMAPFLKLYENLGMPMTMEFKENIGETNGVSIHQIAVKTDLSSMPEDQKIQMESMGMENMVYDIAIADDLLFYSELGGIAALMKRVKEPAEAELIQARNVYPAEGFYYFDLNMDGYMGFIAATLPDDPSVAMMKQQMGSLFKGVDPITSAGFKADGRVMWSMNIPGDLIAKIGQLGMMMQMQQMQQQQMGGNQGMSPSAPEPVDAPEPKADQPSQPSQPAPAP